MPVNISTAVIPGNAKGLIDLAKMIIHRHNELAGNSPLSRFDMIDFMDKTELSNHRNRVSEELMSTAQLIIKQLGVAKKTNLKKQVRLDDLKVQFEIAIRERDTVLGIEENRLADMDGTVVDYLNQCTELLLERFEGNSQELLKWGIILYTGPKSKKKKRSVSI
ncbi:MAG: hypothetical protein IIA45_08485 [Bacteroidetes bacterium]|nr:hypothetical protein [Bacteroidota bacterium]